MKPSIRSQIIAPPGHKLLAFDLSQAETWIVAHLANEPKMIHALTSSDIHTITACAIFYPKHSYCKHTWKKVENESRHCSTCDTTITKEERYLGKRSNHGNSYRMSAQQWTRVINSDSDKPPYVTVSESEAKVYRKMWLDFYPGIVTWWRQIESDLANNNRTMVTPYGRKRTFFENWGDPLFKEATAHVPQSTVADHAFGCVQKELGVEGGILGIHKDARIQKYGRIINTSHDSVMLECKTEAIPEVASIAYNLFKRPLIVNNTEFTIPVDCEVGERWGELEGYKVS